MTPPSPRVLLMGAYGQDNLGDEAILEVHLRELSGHPITVVSSNPAQTRERYGVDAVQTYGGDRARAMRAFASSNVIVFGGGSLVKELNPPYFRYRLVSNLAAASLAAKVMGKGVAFSAMGVERLPSRVGRFLARRAANSSDLFLVRDGASKKKILAIGATIEPQVTADPAYLLDADARAQARAAEFFADAGSGAIYILNPMTSSEVACPREAVARAFTALAAHILRDATAHVVFMPLKSRGEDNDVDVIRQIMADLGAHDRVRVTPEDLRPSDVIAFLQRARMFVGMRHHGVLLSIVARTPILPIHYAEKTENLAREFGLTRHAIAAHALNESSLLSAFAESDRDRDGIVEATVKPFAEMVGRARRNFDDLRAFIRTRGCAEHP